MTRWRGCSAVPSRRLLRWAAAVTVASLLLVVLPEFWLLLLASDLLLILAAVLDLLATPRPGALEITRAAPDKLSVFGRYDVSLQIRNRSKKALAVRLRDEAPTSFRPSVDEVGGFIPARGEACWDYQVYPAARGRLEFGPIHVRYRSVLGLWERGKHVDAAAGIDVFPALESIERYHLLARSNRLDEIGVRRTQARGGASEFESLRDYARGDDIRKLDWKATARRGRLIFRNEQPERNQTVILLVDSGRLMAAEVDGGSKLDHAVNTALLLAHVALTRGDRVGVCTFSHKVHEWLTPRGSQAQNRLIARALYDLKGDYTESDHGRCLKLVAARHSKRALLVVLTDFVDATTASDMLAHLTLAARRHLVLFAALKDPFLDRASEMEPATVRDGFRQAVAVDLLRERREVLERIRKAGGFTIDVAPTGLTPPVVNRYLEVMFRGLL
jgi:uncharacterized protein (DUF58 family)